MQFSSPIVGRANGQERLCAQLEEGNLGDVEPECSDERYEECDLCTPQRSCKEVVYGYSNRQ